MVRWNYAKLKNPKSLVLPKFMSGDIKWVCIKDYVVPTSTMMIFKSGDICSIIKYDDDIYCGSWVQSGRSQPLWKVKLDVLKHFKTLEDLRNDKIEKLI